MILLPPSEGKAVSESGRLVDVESLSFPELTSARRKVLTALMRLCTRSPRRAVETLGLGPKQADDVRRNAALMETPAAPARDVYAGVLFDALGLGSLNDDASRRADERLVVMSGLWGALRPADRIPAYRLGGGVTLPSVGTLAGHWRPKLAGVLAPAAGDGVVIDLRSTTYEAFWRPDPSLTGRSVRIRVLHERDGKRSVVSHHSKATKGRVVRALLESPAVPRRPVDVADLLAELGWKAELTEPERPARPWLLDIVVTHVETR
nr:peroxide stress protein YaaA [Phytoactinopolyspora alkaliphila]